MPSQLDLDIAYVKMAEIWSQLSKAKRKKVGCIIVKNGMIISDGYNGTPKGFDNNCEMQDPRFCWAQEITKPEVLHAESNAITKLAKSTQSSINSTLYSTASPCLDCSKLIIQSGISRVFFKEIYKNLDGVNLLLDADIQVDTLDHSMYK